MAPEGDGVPFDVVDDNKTRLINPRTNQHPDDLYLLPKERELLCLLAGHYTEYSVAAHRWSSRERHAEEGFMRGLLVGLETVATSIDARVQVALWSSLLQGKSQ